MRRRPRSRFRLDPDFRAYVVKVAKPGPVNVEATRIQGQFVRDAINFLLVAKHRTATIQSFRRKENSNHQLCSLNSLLHRGESVPSTAKPSKLQQFKSNELIQPTTQRNENYETNPVNKSNYCMLTTCQEFHHSVYRFDDRRHELCSRRSPRLRRL